MPQPWAGSGDGLLYHVLSFISELQNLSSGLEAKTFWCSLNLPLLKLELGSLVQILKQTVVADCE